MGLYELLQDRAAINILKMLYDNEVAEKSYAMKMALVQRRFPGMPNIPAAAQRLISHGLASADAVGHDAVLAITEKGKRFITVFDQLIATANGERAGKPQGVNLKYALAQPERQILTAAAKLVAQSGKPMVSVHAVCRALYPGEEASRKVPALLRYVRQLEDLRLLQTERIGKNILLKVTESGGRISAEQPLEKAI